MALPLVGLADALRGAGLTVVEHSGWKTRTQRDGEFVPRAVMVHHDASAKGDSDYVPGMMANLANDGAQCWVDRQGDWHLVAAGRMWHAGLGNAWGVIDRNDGNSDSVGVETDHTTGEDWPDAQYSSLVTGTAVILAYLGQKIAHNTVCGHKEYRPSNPDPDGIDMGVFRAQVQDVLNGGDVDMQLNELVQFRPKVGGADRNIWDALDQILNVLGMQGAQIGQVLDALREVLADRLPEEDVNEVIRQIGKKLSQPAG